MRTVIRYIRFVAMALLAHPATAYTQSVDHLERGDRLRVTWDDGAGYSVGFNSYRVTSIDLVRVEDDLIIGQSRGQMVILNRQRVRSVERRIGTKPASAPTMVIGSAGGFAAGFLAGVFKATIDPTVTGSGDVLNDGIVSGVLVGAPAGALLAWIFSRQRGIYERIELGRVRPSVAVSWSNGTELGVRIPTRRAGEVPAAAVALPGVAAVAVLRVRFTPTESPELDSMKCIRRPLLAATLTLAALAGPVSAQLDQNKFRFSTDEKLDATRTPAYTGDHSAIYAYIDENFEAHLANLQRWLRQPSISAQNDGIQEMAEMVRADLEALGFQETAVVPTDGHPGVWGYYDAGAERTMMVYLMYDVQPVNPEDWRSPPFDAEVIDSELGEILMARGATNQKGPERAFLNAIESIIAVEGTLPVNLMVLAEGEEELGSPHYEQLVDRFEDRLRTADGAFFPFNSQGPTGAAGMSLGVKGILYTEMEYVGGDWGGPTEAEIHGSYKAIVDSPVWRLVQALSSLVSEDGNTILVPGYYDDVRAPTDEEQRLINAMADTWNDAGQQAALGVEQWIDGITGRDAIMRYLYHPTLNIDGIWGGYTEEGVKTILPHMATAKVDSRLPYGLDPDEALALIRAHLDAQGFDDIEIRKLSGYPAAQTSVDAAIVQAAIGVFNKYGHTPEVSPRLAGSAPFYQFTERLGLPLVFAGFGHGSGAHAPNEYMVIEPAEGSSIAGLREIERAYVDLLFALAAQRPITE